MVKAAVWVALSLGLLLLALLLLKASLAFIGWVFAHVIVLACGFMIGWAAGRAAKE